MSFNYTGDPRNITTPLTQGVVSCASGAGGLVLVGTSTAHLMASQDFVQVSGVVGCTEANTSSTITVIDSTHFLLNGTTFVNPYSSGGTVVDHALSPYFQLPNDGEAGTVESIEAALQILADRTQYLKYKSLPPVTYLASGTWVCPPGVRSVLLELVAAGGGGGGSAGSDLTTNSGATGGGGGACGKLVVCEYAVTPGVAYPVVVGAGGTAGANGAAGVSGGKGGTGGTSSFNGVAKALGGGGGFGGVALVAITCNMVVFGGSDSVGFNRGHTYFAPTGAGTNGCDVWVPPGCGGPSGFMTNVGNNGSIAGGAGASSPISPLGDVSAGGAGGAAGTSVGSYCGGSGGGGGAAGPYGVGAVGGAGGAANSVGTGNPGTSGAQAGDNTGSGGGGAGGSGAGNGTGWQGGFGGIGGSGRVKITVR